MTQDICTNTIHCTLIEIVARVEVSQENVRTQFKERFKIYLPYCFQYGERYGHPGKVLLVNRHYQPLGVHVKEREYSDYPDGWWLQANEISKFFPPCKDLVDRAVVYDDLWDFTSKSGPSYRKYEKQVIAPLMSILGGSNLLIAEPDFKQIIESGQRYWGW
jgi:hypothetical protein